MISMCGCGRPCLLFEDQFGRPDEEILNTGEGSPPAVHTDSTGQWICFGLSSPLTRWHLTTEALTLDVPAGGTTTWGQCNARHRVLSPERAVQFSARVWIPKAGAAVRQRLSLNIDCQHGVGVAAEFECNSDPYATCGVMRIIDLSLGGSAGTAVGCPTDVIVKGLVPEAWHEVS